MKRSGFKRKPTKSLKKTPLKKESKTKVSTLKRKLWTVFSKYIRLRDKGICFTCNRKCEGFGYHAGHFISKAVGGIELYFDEDNVNGQCYNCNINLGGNQYEYAKRLGFTKAEMLSAKKRRIVKWTVQNYEEKIEYYTNKLKEYERNDRTI